MQTWQAQYVMAQEIIAERLREASMARLARRARTAAASERLPPGSRGRRFSVELAGVCVTVVLTRPGRYPEPARP